MVLCYIDLKKKKKINILPSGHSLVVKTLAFQANDEGSIPSARLFSELFISTQVVSYKD